MKHKLLYVAALCSFLLSGITHTVVLAQRARTVKTRTTKTVVRKTTAGQYPESSERLLTQNDIEHTTPWGVKVMMNEIYARHGFIFRDVTLKKHFRKEKWYKGSEQNMKKIKLTDIEIQNIAFLKQHQPKARL